MSPPQGAVAEPRDEVRKADPTAPTGCRGHGLRFRLASRLNVQRPRRGRAASSQVPPRATATPSGYARGVAASAARGPAAAPEAPPEAVPEAVPEEGAADEAEDEAEAEDEDEDEEAVPLDEAPGTAIFELPSK